MSAQPRRRGREHPEGVDPPTMWISALLSASPSKQMNVPVMVPLWMLLLVQLSGQPSVNLSARCRCCCGRACWCTRQSSLSMPPLVLL